LVENVTKKDFLCEKAMKRFLNGYNCAQSVLLTTFEHWNGKNALIPKIATGFGAGIGRCGSVCGALTGDVMAIGTRYGTNKPSAEKKLQSYKLSQMLYREFDQSNTEAFAAENSSNMTSPTLKNSGRLAVPRSSKKNVHFLSELSSRFCQTSTNPRRTNLGFRFLRTFIERPAISVRKLGLH
jgi:C_GCAxxG_C_C family probable redox protein